MAVILDHLKLGLGGIGVLYKIGIFVELRSFPDLTQDKADINKKNLWVEVNNTTLEEEAKIQEEMYVLH